jgi:hypothetical protein
VIECLPSMHKALGSIPSTAKKKNYATEVDTKKMGISRKPVLSF